MMFTEPISIQKAEAVQVALELVQQRPDIVLTPEASIDRRLPPSHVRYSTEYRQ